jgi:hypothetical protein
VEALPAAHKAILPDQSMWITAHTAASKKQQKARSQSARLYNKIIIQLNTKCIQQLGTNNPQTMWECPIIYNSVVNCVFIKQKQKSAVNYQMW